MERNDLEPVALLMDGGSENVELIKALTHRTQPVPAEHRYVTSITINPATGERMAIIVDPVHCFKNARNAILGSHKFNRDSGAWRWRNGHAILWEHITWVIEEDSATDTMKRTKMTKDHGELNAWSKMNVRLCAQTLSGSTALVMDGIAADECAFPDRPPPPGAQCCLCPAATADYCRYWNELFDLFNSADFISSVGHKNLQRILELNDYFTDKWEQEIYAREGYAGKGYTDSQRERMMPSRLTRYLQKLSCRGLVVAVEIFHERYPQVAQQGRGIQLCRLNQDSLENFFGRIRAGNRNPDMFALPHIFQAQVVSRDVSQQIKANAGTAKHL